MNCYQPLSGALCSLSVPPPDIKQLPPVDAPALPAQKTPVPLPKELMFLVPEQSASTQTKRPVSTTDSSTSALGSSVCSPPPPQQTVTKSPPVPLLSSFHSSHLELQSVPESTGKLPVPSLSSSHGARAEPGNNIHTTSAHAGLTYKYPHWTCEDSWKGICAGPQMVDSANEAGH
ncbi:hypothetical protein KOW79_002853 [Hemibagrus wyckioides]|uniref:Uncharacterized protein n=1 Tax=Hemibagrus wyckioides TaxID=337641 RepID=A0A9D3SRA9_9TELE|nr:hypothetical protein KOW79_002853 [Hemibagrus wyckioides]